MATNTGAENEPSDVRGRPTKLTPAVADRVVELVRGGNYVEVAAAAVGVARSTVFDWMRRGARGKRGAYRDFSVAIEKAQAEAEMGLLGLIDKAADKGVWTAAAWRLERMHPERWGRPTRPEPQEVSGQGGAELVARLRDAMADMDHKSGVCTPKHDAGGVAVENGHLPSVETSAVLLGASSQPGESLLPSRRKQVQVF